MTIDLLSADLLSVIEGSVREEPTVSVSEPLFVHLNVHSEFSLVDSTLTVKQIAKKAKADGQVAIALTDANNLCGMVQFYKAALAEGVKPIVGADVMLQDGSGNVYPVTLYCQNYDGYQNLSYLVSRAYTEGQAKGMPCIDWAWLADHHQSLMVVLGMASLPAQLALAGSVSKGTDILNAWLRLMPNRVFLSIARTGKAQQSAWLSQAVAWSGSLQLPVIAVNEVRFAQEEDFDAHEVRVCIREGFVLDDPNRPKRYSSEQYLRTQAEMAKLFSDMPIVLANTVNFARACNLSLTLGKSFLPDFPVPDGMTIDSFFQKTSRDGLAERLAILVDESTAEGRSQAEAYRERLEIELDTIIAMQFPGYFLIVADFIQWAKDQGIPVGPGRGSGAGSLVAYALKITDLDPLPYDLLFERFLNPERVSMPDFDIDFCMDRRDEVIDYVAQKYGRDHVSQIITYGTMAAKAVVRDVGRVLALSYGFVDRIAKLIPNELGITLSEAIDKEAELKEKFEQDDDVNHLLTLALKLEGLTRNVGRHAGGVVIGPRPLWTFTPMYCEADGSNLVTQFDKNDVESVGLVKFDFLGLRTLTIIDWAVKAVNANRYPVVMRQTGEIKADGPLVDISRIPLDDPAVYKLIKTGNTTGIFQLESTGMQDLIRRLLPDCFEDIIALVALFRPGPLGSGMVDDFINRKHGREKVVYLHDMLEPILKPTYGTILYQEQVMQTAQVMANYSLGGADLLRRAMGKKKPEEMAEQREIFRQGSAENNVDPDIAVRVFDIMEEFANYGFNKSHSAAYALVSYQTAWLKTHYPAHLMAAVLTADLDNTEKVVHMLKECRQMGLTLLPPDINESSATFTVVSSKTLRYGLGAIKGAGEAALTGVLDGRNREGKFADLFDFCARNNKQINRRVIEALIDSGAMDSLRADRATLHANLTKAIEVAQHLAHQQATGQNDLFGGSATDPDSDQAMNVYDPVEPWTLTEQLIREKAVLGFFVSGHPFDAVREQARAFAYTVDRLPTPKPNEVGKRGGQMVLLAGRIDSIRSKIGKKGDKLIFMGIEDQDAVQEVSVFGELCNQLAGQLQVDQLVVVEGELSLDGYSGQTRLRATRVLPFEQARLQFAKAVEITLSEGQLSSEAQIQQLVQLVKQVQREGGIPVRWQWQSENWQVPLSSTSQHSIIPTADWLTQVEALGIRVTISYSA